jgi:hypothetical protein
MFGSACHVWRHNPTVTPLGAWRNKSGSKDAISIAGVEDTVLNPACPYVNVVVDVMLCTS